MNTIVREPILTNWYFLYMFYDALFTKLKVQTWNT
jgi:hypothetical protein